MVSLFEYWLVLTTVDTSLVDHGMREILKIPFCVPACLPVVRTTGGESITAVFCHNEGYCHVIIFFTYMVELLYCLSG